MHLEYGYEQVMAEVAQYQAQKSNPPSALFIGGGGYTFPQYLVARFPGARVRVLEIDPGVTQIAHEKLGLPADTTIESFNGDARLYMTGRPDRTFDLVVGDAFNDFSVPYHLTTSGFNERVKAWLAPGGFYMINLIDGYRGDFVRSFAYTLRQTFRYVYFVPGSKDWRTTSRMTHVMIAGDTPLDANALASVDAGDGWAQLYATLLPEADLNALLAEGRTIALSDDYAPVEQMLSSMVRNDLPAATGQPTVQPTATPGQ